MKKFKVITRPDGRMETQTDPGTESEEWRLRKTRRALRAMLDGRMQFHDDPRAAPKVYEIHSENITRKVAPLVPRETLKAAARAIVDNVMGSGDKFVNRYNFTVGADGLTTVSMCRPARFLSVWVNGFAQVFGRDVSTNKKGDLCFAEPLKRYDEVSVHWVPEVERRPGTVLRGPSQ